MMNPEAEARLIDEFERYCTAHQLSSDHSAEDLLHELLCISERTRSDVDKAHIRWLNDYIETWTLAEG